MNILVTGGCGFIGSTFIRQRLRDDAHHISVVLTLDNLSHPGNRANLAEIAEDGRHTFFQGDIRDEALVGSLLLDYRINAIVNFAAEPDVDHPLSASGAATHTNLHGTQQLLEATRRYWTALSSAEQNSFRFLQISTDEVYGPRAATAPPATEESPLAPHSLHAASKAGADLLVRVYHRSFGLPAMIATCSSSYGPHPFPEKLIPFVIQTALEHRPISLDGEAGQVRNWLHVEDEAAAIWQILQRGRPGENYNVGGVTACSNLEIAEAVCVELDRKQPRNDGRSYRAQIVPAPERSAPAERFSVNCSKLRSELGWSPLSSLANGIQRTVEWYLLQLLRAAEITGRTTLSTRPRAELAPASS